MIIGLLFAILAGILVGLQNIFNTRVNDHAGTWSTTALVLGLGFLASMTLGVVFEGKELFVLKNMETWFWFSGLIGVGVVVCLVQGTRLLGPTFAISIVLTSQLGSALMWDSLGLFGLEKIPFTSQQLLGVLVIIGGVIMFKFGGSRAEHLKVTKVVKHTLKQSASVER
ncbi:DMT family transporter [Fictibacillus sp. 26RED30]|uniref:DMT family transporter n=1 Tax=Fictibacillus sp. 26RED30 TaxID=2745877 RepID=UPI0018CFAD08|nr:DMT family transporter [Fictibacillus sp. 26RED30]MBH0161572.1 DMT family transporter [Fictibacillus sp. 26RED30]